MRLEIAMALALCVGLTARGLAYEVVAVENGGRLTGVVTTDATSTAGQSIATTKDVPVCHESVPDESILVGKDGGLADCVVAFVQVDAGKDPSGMPEAVLANQGCRYVPHVQAMTVGQRLTVVNEDPILHNTHGYDADDKTVFNFALPLQDRPVKKKMKDVGVLRAKCDAGHTWMDGYVYVNQNPYYAVTDPDGAFEIDGIPAGEYTVKIWHPVLGETEKAVTIAAGATAELVVPLNE